MNSILKLALRAAGVFVLICIGLFFIAAQRTTKDLGDAAKQSAKAVEQIQLTVADANDRLYSKGGLVDIAKKTMLHLDRVAGEAAITTAHERVYWDTTSKKIIALVDTADRTLAHLDETQQRIGGRAEQDLADLDVSLKQLPALLAQGRQDLETANVLLADPNIPAILQNVAATSKNTADTTEQLAKTSKLIEQKVEQMTKPASLLKTIGVSLLDTAFKVASFFK